MYSPPLTRITSEMSYLFCPQAMKPSPCTVTYCLRVDVETPRREAASGTYLVIVFNATWNLFIEKIVAVFHRILKFNPKRHVLIGRLVTIIFYFKSRVSIDSSKNDTNVTKINIFLILREHDK